MLKCILQGIVVSDKNDKIVVVCVECCFVYFLFQKIVCWFKKYKVYDEINQYKVGDVVFIEECVLILKDKCWMVVVVQ